MAVMAAILRQSQCPAAVRAKNKIVRQEHAPASRDRFMPNSSATAPAILDIEASGFGRGSYPIEIGVALADGETYCVLVCPQNDWLHWDASAEAVHGISRDTLLARGRPVAEVVNELNDLLRGQTVYSDGWGNDFAWLGRLYDEVGRAPSFKLDMLTRTMSDAMANAWNATREQIEVELALGRHRASNDARILQLTWLRLSQSLSPVVLRARG